MAGIWQYRLLQTVSRVLCTFPYKALLGLGEGLAPLYRLLAKKQEKRAIVNMMTAFSCSAEEAQALTKAMFVNLTKTALELFYMPRLDREWINAHIEVRGLDHVERALASQKGVVVLTAHMGNWEWMGAAMASYGYPTTTIVKTQPNAGFNRFITELRQRAGLEIFARDGADIIRAAKAMKQNKLVGFLADQDGGPQGVPLLFLGQMGSAPLGPATFAKRFQAPILPVFITRKEEGHIIHILEPFYYEDGGDDDLCRLTEQCVRITEDFVRAHPAEWLWFQHRWRTTLAEMEEASKKGERGKGDAKE